MRLRSLGVIGLAALVGCTSEIRINAEDPDAYVIYRDGERHRYEKEVYTFEATRDIRLILEHHGQSETIHLDGEHFYRVARTDNHVFVYECRLLRSYPHIQLRHPPVYGCRKSE